MDDTARTANQNRIAATIFKLLAARAADASICPSDAARVLSKNWRPLMPAVRAMATILAHQNALHITRGKQSLDPNQIEGGPIRLRRGTAWAARAKSFDGEMTESVDDAEE